jgi:cytochrome P450
MVVTVQMRSTIRALDSAVAHTREDAVVWALRGVDAHAERLLGPIRRHRPLMAIGRTLVVTRRDDVLAVLADSDTFAPPFLPRLPGRFLLGVADAAHRRDTGELRAVIRAEDDDAALRRLATTAAERQVHAALPIGTLDVGTGLVQPVLDTVVGDYLGAPGPDHTTQLRWTRDLFQYIFLTTGGLPTVRQRAARASTEMGRHLDHLIATRRASAGGSHDVLGRFLDRQREAPDTALDDEEIRGYLMGLAIGWMWHGAKAPLIAVDELLDRPVALAEAREAAQADDLDQLRRVLWETLRFRPVQVGLPRVCRRDTTLAAGTGRARRIRKGTNVIVGTHSAMWDEAAVPDPEIFDSSRAEGQYLIFGDGLHRCFGEHIMRIQLPALLAPLLRLDGLRRAGGREGRLRWQGPAPDGLRVEFTPQRGCDAREEPPR